MIAVLHTWGQQLSLHSHLHCIVPGGEFIKKDSGKTIERMANSYFLSKPCRKYLELNIARNSKKMNP